MQALSAVTAWPVRRAAAGVVFLSATGIRREHAGVGDAEAFSWASVTKLCTSLAVLVAMEEGIVALDEPAGPPGSTVAHLLAHASGLAPDGGAVLTAPGRRRIYSNEGFRILGQLVADRAGCTFGDYLTEGVLEPLSMTGTSLQVPSNLQHPAPGEGDQTALGAPSGLQGPLRDLLALAQELLGPTIVDRSTLDLATKVAFPHLAGVLPGFGRHDPCDWGLGFELRDAKEPHWTGHANSLGTFGHFGQSGGFLWVDPQAKAACAALSDRTFGAWAAAAWPQLSDGVLSELAATRGYPGPS